MSEDAWVAKRSTDGWTIWKEITGTFVAVIPFALGFFVYLQTIRDNGILNTKDITALQAQRTEQKAQDDRQLERLDSVVKELTEIKVELRAQAIVNGRSSNTRH